MVFSITRTPSFARLVERDAIWFRRLSLRVFYEGFDAVTQNALAVVSLAVTGLTHGRQGLTQF